MSTPAIYGCRPNPLVRDLSASLAFYADGLGFAIGWHWSDRLGKFLEQGERDEPGDPGTALIHRDRAHLMLTQLPGGLTRVHLDVDTPAQVDDLYVEWLGRGVEIAEPPVEHAWGMYEMRVHDPDENVLRVSAHLNAG